MSLANFGHTNNRITSIKHKKTLHKVKIDEQVKRNCSLCRPPYWRNVIVVNVMKLGLVSVRLGIPTWMTVLIYFSIISF